MTTNPRPEPQYTVQQLCALIEQQLQHNVPVLRARLQDVLQQCKTLDEARLVQQSLNRLGNISSSNNQQLASLRKELMPSVINKIKQLTPKSARVNQSSGKSTLKGQPKASSSLQSGDSQIVDPHIVEKLVETLNSLNQRIGVIEAKVPTLTDVTNLDQIDQGELDQTPS